MVVAVLVHDILELPVFLGHHDGFGPLDFLDEVALLAAECCFVLDGRQRWQHLEMVSIRMAVLSNLIILHQICLIDGLT